MNAREAPGWKIVLRKEVRSRRILPEGSKESNAPLFTMGNDEDCEGLRLERELQEGQQEAVGTGHDVLLEEVFVAGRHRSVRGRGRRHVGTAGTNAAVSNQRHGRGGAASRARRGRARGRHRADAVEEGNESPQEKDWLEEDFLYAEG